MFFNEDGSYKDFDREQPTSRQGGKRTVVENLKRQFGYKFLCVIGDGATDLETFGPPNGADLFIGYGESLSLSFCSFISLIS